MMIWKFKFPDLVLFLSIWEDFFPTITQHQLCSVCVGIVPSEISLNGFSRFFETLHFLYRKVQTFILELSTLNKGFRIWDPGVNLYDFQDDRVRKGWLETNPTYKTVTEKTLHLFIYMWMLWKQYFLFSLLHVCNNKNILDGPTRRSRFNNNQSIEKKKKVDFTCGGYNKNYNKVWVTKERVQSHNIVEGSWYGMIGTIVSTVQNYILDTSGLKMGLQNRGQPKDAAFKSHQRKIKYKVGE